jgi:hypothetical protein
MRTRSGDHGVINTWDRLPFLTTVRTGQPSLTPAYTNITRNFFISNYNSFGAWLTTAPSVRAAPFRQTRSIPLCVCSVPCVFRFHLPCLLLPRRVWLRADWHDCAAGVDNDDGSSYYDIGENVFYVNEGLKSDYHGHDKRYHHNLNVGAAVCCFQFGFVSGRGAASNDPEREFYEAGHADRCLTNRCVQRPGGSWVHGAFAILWGCNASLPAPLRCAPGGKAVMALGGNRVYREANRTGCPFKGGCDVACGMEATDASMLSVAGFQRQCGVEAGFPADEVHDAVPAAAQLGEWARELLGLPLPLPHVLPMPGPAVHLPADIPAGDHHN